MIVTRFAPSPTGALHIGSVRTALYSWLIAKQSHGKFILRIEDTDRERSTQASVDGILAGMKWLGLDWDEGPFYQTHRFDRYQAVVNQLIETNQAYYCNCSKSRLEALREAQMEAKEKPRYDGKCRHQSLTPSPENPCVVRFSTPQTGVVEFDDLIKGKITIANSELDDLVIWRSDNTPTYNLTVVVDDWDMGVTHVLRGDDHINNTPRQINILKALDATLPQYGHMPMILGHDGKRLSKRHGATDVLAFKSQGFLPQALLNYLVRLGWSHGDQEIFSIEEMIQLFDMNHINGSASAFDLDKLKWLNQHYIKTLPPEDLIKPLTELYLQSNIDISQGPSLTQLIEAFRERCSTLIEMVEKSRFIYEEFEHYDNEAAKKHLNINAKEVLENLLNAFSEMTQWNENTIHAAIEKVGLALDLKLGKIGPPLRVAVTGSTQSPSINATLSLVGQEKTIARINKAIKKIS